MEKYLNIFQNDEYLREAVKEFMYKELDRMALEMVYDKQDVSGIADAKELVTRAFTELYERYGKKVEIKIESIR
jgi:hypothetical protein